jgi:hypothetical protein
MARTKLPKYCLHKASAQAIVRLDGQVFYLGKYKNKISLEKYDELIAEYISNNRKLPPTRVQSELWVDHLAFKYLEDDEDY